MGIATAILFLYIFHDFIRAFLAFAFFTFHVYDLLLMMRYTKTKKKLGLAQSKPLNPDITSSLLFTRSPRHAYIFIEQLKSSLLLYILLS